MIHSITKFYMCNWLYGITFHLWCRYNLKLVWITFSDFWYLVLRRYMFLVRVTVLIRFSILFTSLLLFICLFKQQDKETHRCYAHEVLPMVHQQGTKDPLLVRTHSVNFGRCLKHCSEFWVFGQAPPVSFSVDICVFQNFSPSHCISGIWNRLDTSSITRPISPGLAPNLTENAFK